MTVLNNALLHNVEGIANGSNAKIANIAVGAQLGLGPQLPQIDAATPLVFAPAVAIVTHIPTMFNDVPNMGSILKALVERHAKTITGIDFGYEMDEGSGYTMADGQEAKVPTKTKRTAISPNMTFPEIQGNLVWNMFRTWMSMISHPDTHHSKMAAMTNNDQLDPFVYSYFSMDMLFIQFDPTMLPQNIIDAAFVTTMYPRTTGQLNLKREIATSDVPERSIDFSGILQHNSSVYQAAVQIATTLRLHQGNFDQATAISTEIESRAQGLGIQQEIDQIMAEFR